MPQGCDKILSVRLERIADMNIVEIDLSYLAGELGVGLEDLHNLFLLYCSEMESEIARAGRFLEEQDWQLLRRTVHNIKGVSANLGLKAMFEAARTIDVRLKENTTDTICHDFEALERCYSDTKASVKAAFGKHGMII